MPQLPVTIGKESNDSMYRCDLADLPHLFVCYSERPQFYDFLYNSGLLHLAADYAVAAGADTYRSLRIKSHFYCKELYLKEPVTELTNTRGWFLKNLITEWKRRMKHAAIKKANDPPLIVLIEDVFDLVITPKRQPGLHFLQLLTEGPKYGIHIIAGSVRTYMNLVRQLNTLTTAENNRSLPFAAELIINPEDLFFFRSREATEYTRYFHQQEGKTPFIQAPVI